MSKLEVPAWRLIDIGINLTDDMYAGTYNKRRQHAADLEEVVQRALRVGVSDLIITGGNVRESRHAASLCQTVAAKGIGCYSTIGCHPTRCSEFLKDPEAYYGELDALLSTHSVHHGGCAVAVGEVGLDYDRLCFCTKEVQQEYFLRQLDLAERHRLPLFLHDRNTNGDFYQILSQHMARLHGGVVHSFTGTAGELQRYLDLTLYIGINGCSLKTEENLAVAKLVPLERLLIETDGPWCDIRNTHASRRLLQQRGAERASKLCVSDELLAPFPVCKKEKFAAG
ncbi:TatD DNase family protein, partial [Strigomonas culicis]